MHCLGYHPSEIFITHILQLMMLVQNLKQPYAWLCDKQDLCIIRMFMISRQLHFATNWLTKAVDASDLEESLSLLSLSVQIAAIAPSFTHKKFKLQSYSLKLNSMLSGSSDIGASCSLALPVRSLDSSCQCSGHTTGRSCS